MHAIADTHLHIYPNYDIEAAFSRFLKQTPKEPSQIRIACLAERHDCHFFSSIHSEETVLKQFEVIDASSSEMLIEAKDDKSQFYLVAGRQVISKENIEVLALACPSMIKDGSSAEAIIKQVNEIGGLAVVAWSPGKWFFSRKKVVTNLLDIFTPNDFVLGDTTLRPYFWPLPNLMKKAKNKGYKIIAGSDPLPFSGEESWYGAYTSQLDGSAETASELIVGLRLGSTACIDNKGQRSWPHTLLFRLRANAASK